MRAPKTTTLLWLAGVFVLLTAVFVPNYYPGPVPIVGRDGAQILGTDGTPLVHRDMASYYRVMLPSFVSAGCFLVCLLWLLVRLLRLAYERVRHGEKTDQ